jgi:phytoene synthase
VTAGVAPPKGASGELDAAGITAPALRGAYARCRALNAAHGRTYFLATRLLTPAQRPAIHALYGFARMADDVVDTPGTAGPDEVVARLEEVRARMRVALAGPTDPADTAALLAEEPVVAALAHTVERYGIDHRHLEDFMDSMAMDLTVGEYASFDDLARYVHGSAAVIGLQVLPVLGTVVPRDEAAPYAADLGVAFQITNFLRDVGEDLDRGRVYLPAAELAAFGVDRDLLTWCRTTARPDRRVRRAMAHLVARTRAIYRRAEHGIALLDPVSRPCVRTAHVLYGGILDEIVAADYDVLTQRVVVGSGRRAAVALPGLARAVGTRWTRRLTGAPSPTPVHSGTPRA